MDKRDKILVTYLCWGCGSSKTVYEESDIPIPAREVWNLCPNCVLHAEAAKEVAMGKEGVINRISSG